MRLFRFFAGPDVPKLEQQADALFEARSYGRAKLMYERALDKLQKSRGSDSRDAGRIGDKHRRAVEALARDHCAEADSYLEGGHWEEAGDLMALARELTADDAFRRELDQRLANIERQAAQAAAQAISDELYEDIGAGPDMDDVYTDPDMDEDADGYFFALCGPLPEEVRQAYLSYGDAFRSGYIALNQGDFETAAADLEQALDLHGDADTYIPMELAAAYLNLGRHDEARDLLESFRQRHPDVLPAYQMLCDCYLEQNDYDRAAALLKAVPAELAESLAVIRLKGETFNRSGRPEAARELYEKTMETYGWNDTVARELADTCQALNDPDRALSLYKEIIGRCTGCGSKVDPMVKHNYAELCFHTGQHTTDILEMYLALVRELPDNASHYYDRVSRIYTAQGNTTEAGRFHAFSEQAGRGRGSR